MRPAVGIVTMEAGLGMPGACLEDCINPFKVFGPTKGLDLIIVDGKYTERAKKEYEAAQYQDIFARFQVIDSPWNGSLLDQLRKIVRQLQLNQWWMMLDDDEIPSKELVQMFCSLTRTGLDPEVNAIYSPRITCFSHTDGLYYPAETPFYPDKVALQTTEGIKEKEKQAQPRKHIMRNERGLDFLHSSGGHHCVPIQRNEKAVIITAPHYHVKAPEQYVLADCWKSMLDPENEMQDLDIAREYREVLKDSNINTYESYTDAIINDTVSDSFKWFCRKYSNHPKRPSRPFMWYYILAHPEKNPYPEKDWDWALSLLLNDNWKEVLANNINRGAGFHVHVTPYLKGHKEKAK